jgi:D-alanine-D-alanine ligase
MQRVQARPRRIVDRTLARRADLRRGVKMAAARSKISVGLLFGGRSAEHEVSKASAANILRALDPERYNVSLIGITRDGRWLLCDAGNGAGTGAVALVIPDDAPQLGVIPGGQGRLVWSGSKSSGEAPRFDVMFPVLHGPNGEDGTVQGALELAGVAYVGSAVTGSAAAMDKDVGKRLLRDAGLPLLPFLTLTAASMVGYRDAVAALGTQKVFVKPSNMGSSVGVSGAASEDEYKAACELAFRFDHKVLVERSVDAPREIECSVLEDADGTLRASALGEIVPAEKHGFYSYEAKYLDADGAALQIPANVPSAQADRIRELAITSFRLLNCEGMARVDFFLKGDDIFVNELNTLPGFTQISMYPKLWEASGLTQGELMDRLIAHALARHARRQALSFER